MKVDGCSLGRKWWGRGDVKLVEKCLIEVGGVFGQYCLGVLEQGAGHEGAGGLRHGVQCGQWVLRQMVLGVGSLWQEEDRHVIGGMKGVGGWLGELAGDIQTVGSGNGR